MKLTDLFRRSPKKRRKSGQICGGRAALKIFCLVLSVLMLTSCTGRNTDKTPGGDSSAQPSGKLTVYAEQYYRNALERIFRAAGSFYPGLTAEWSENAGTADIIISDLPPSGELMPIGEAVPESLINQSLLRRSGGETVGIPLFLHIDSIWYDTLLYGRENIEPPYTCGDLLSLPLAKEYPAVCGTQTPDVLFWAGAAPLYLANGGTAEQLSAAEFDRNILAAALERIASLRDEGVLRFAADAEKDFTSTRAAAVISSFARLTEAENSMSALSEITFAPRLLSAEAEKAFLVIRADTVSVRADADRGCALAFLKLLFEPKNLINLLSETHIPLACKVSYGSRSIPENVQDLYESLASNLLDTVYISAEWQNARAAEIYSAIGGFAGGSLTAAEAVQYICK